MKRLDYFIYTFIGAIVVVLIFMGIFCLLAFPIYAALQGLVILFRLDCVVSYSYTIAAVSLISIIGILDFINKHFYHK